jgi:pyruvate-ferredoxin/flavodoxin oxidoreductase
MPKEVAIGKIKSAIYESYYKKGEKVVQKNYEAVDKTLENLFELDYAQYAIGKIQIDAPVPDNSPDFVKSVLAKIIAGEGDGLPVSAFPVDGLYPSGTTKFEKKKYSRKCSGLGC